MSTNEIITEAIPIVWLLINYSTLMCLSPSLPICAGRGTVGLVSFPGSGNTWVRQLLQMATGICTGKVNYFTVLIITSKYRHIVALDVLQSKNAVTQVILFSYHSLPLVKVLHKFPLLLSFF